LGKANIAHFACHGRNNWENPLESGLLMAHDEFLTVRDFLGLRLPDARLATLSACETDIVGFDMPNEVVMLPSALAQSGDADVVASLWSVADVGTAMLMVRFYESWRVDRLEPAHALRAAQRWLRDTTNHEKADYFHQFLPSLAPRMTETVAAEFFSAVMEMKEGLEARSFSDPYWWAAFYLTGA
jgi:CHAT domain-containing protein